MQYIETPEVIESYPDNDADAIDKLTHAAFHAHVYCDFYYPEYLDVRKYDDPVSIMNFSIRAIAEDMQIRLDAQRHAA